MRRADYVALLVLVSVLGGCMRIYPDPELPDLEVTWFDSDCMEGTGDVVVTLVGLDEEYRMERTVPCADARTTFADVPRQRYRVEGSLLDDTGEGVYFTAEYEVDLRNGTDETAWLYFTGGATFHVGWIFDMGATCESLGADGVEVLFLPTTFAIYAACEEMSVLAFPGNGTHTVVLRALAGDTTVAISSESAPFTLMPPIFTDIGIQVLTPCGDACP